MTESDIEQLTIEKLQTLGYHYLYGPDIAPDGTQAERQSFADVILSQRVKSAIDRLNPDIPSDARTYAFREVITFASPDLLANNERFHRFLTNGIDVEFQRDGATRGAKVWLVDFDQPENNEFLVVNQFTVVENNLTKRPDVVLFVNGLPLVVIELKNPADETATIRKAFDQVQTYKAIIPALLTYNALLVISDSLDARAGSLSADYSRFLTWKTPPLPPSRGELTHPLPLPGGELKASSCVSQLETLIQGMLNPPTLLDLIRHFTVFEKSSSKYSPLEGGKGV